MNLPAPAQAVLDFWFGAPDDPTHGQRRPAWFQKDPQFDATIADRHAALLGGPQDPTSPAMNPFGRMVTLEAVLRMPACLSGFAAFYFCDSRLVASP